MDSTNEINEFLKRLKNGDKCMNEFFRAVSGYVKFIAYRYLVDKSFVDDVVTNTFYKVFDNIQKFNELQNGKAWISKIAQNEAFTINNRERKHYHADLDEVSEEIACTVDVPQGLELAAAFDKALDELDEKDREIVELRVFDGMTFKEIANKQNMYVGTVYKQYMRNIKKIYRDIYEIRKNYGDVPGIDK